MKPKVKKQTIAPTVSNGLVKVKFNTGAIHEYMPQLAKKLVDANVANYI